jgi:hypothetical protein
MIDYQSKEVAEASDAFFKHIDSCSQCAEANDQENELGLCEEGQKLYDAEAAAMRKSGASIQLVKQADGGWTASFSDGRPGGGFGSTAQEALCNLSDIVEKCMGIKEGV